MCFEAGGWEWQPVGKVFTCGGLPGEGYWVIEAGLIRLICLLTCFTLYFNGLSGGIQLAGDIIRILPSDEMAKGQDRVAKQHPRARKSHHILDLGPHFRSVTVHFAVLAGGFFPAERTLIQAFIHISLQFCTGFAKGIAIVL